MSLGGAFDSAPLLRLLALAAAALVLSGCERPPVDTVQRGYRGTGMVEVYNPRLLASQEAANTLPEPLAPAAAEGPRARDVFKNVQVLGDLSVGEFTRTMAAITAWVSPQQGCTYCHAPGEDLAADTLYTKVVSRRMLEMNRHINADWKTHVGNVGVTCYTCHRGQNVPQQVWFKAAEGVGTARAAGNDGGQNHPSPQVGVASLPYDPFTPFLLDDTSIRVVGSTALPTGNRQSIKQTEWTYGLMMHMSSSLGVNCTYCHNSRSFQSWDMSTPQRETSWYGIRMVRDLNNDYLLPLESRFPQHRLGPTGDVAKIGCGTCHQGAYKPLYGQSMLATHPELVGSAVQTTLVAPPGAMPKAAAADRSVTLLFASGSAELPADGLRELNALVEAARSEAQGKLVISGFHSASGAQDVNEALAKQRALAVRDALVAAGIGEERLVLQKPAVTEANVGGEDTQARRVEVSLSMQ